MTDNSSIYRIAPSLEQDISRRFFLGAALGIAAGLATAHTAVNASRTDVVLKAVGGAGVNIALEVRVSGFDGNLWAWDQSARSLARRSMGTARAIQVASDWAARHGSGVTWLEEQLDYLPRGTHQVALVAGFGGATGSAVAPELMIALRARQICARMFCTLPFGFEGESRLRAATAAVERL